MHDAMYLFYVNYDKLITSNKFYYLLSPLVLVDDGTDIHYHLSVISFSGFFFEGQVESSRLSIYELRKVIYTLPKGARLHMHELVNKTLSNTTKERVCSKVPILLQIK